MTAPDTNSAESQNSVFREEDWVPTPADDRTLRAIKHASQTASVTTRRALAIETGWSPSVLEDVLTRLESEGYAELIGESGCQRVVLTNRGETAARRSE